jgi:ABC-type sugar transport system ATPase subunit
MTLLLEATNLRKRFGGIEAVRDVSFAVHSGECVVLAGDNGAGKSTVIKCQRRRKNQPRGGAKVYHSGILN